MAEGWAASLREVCLESRGRAVGRRLGGLQPGFMELTGMKLSRNAQLSEGTSWPFPGPGGVVEEGKGMKAPRLGPELCARAHGAAPPAPPRGQAAGGERGGWE